MTKEAKLLHALKWIAETREDCHPKNIRRVALDAIKDYEATNQQETYERLEAALDKEDED